VAFRQKVNLSNTVPLQVMSLLHLYRAPGFSAARRDALLAAARERISSDIREIDTEYCFNIDAAGDLAPDESQILSWLLSETCS
jgi:hypothetical protein